MAETVFIMEVYEKREPWLERLTHLTAMLNKGVNAFAHARK
jgi:hypothetical protein